MVTVELEGWRILDPALEEVKAQDGHRGARAVAMCNVGEMVKMGLGGWVSGVAGGHSWLRWRSKRRRRRPVVGGDEGMVVAACGGDADGFFV